MTQEEKARRIKVAEQWFGSLGVKPLPEQMRGMLNLTHKIPYATWCQALHELVLAKADGFTTTPQPGQVFEQARKIARRLGGLEYHGDTGQWAEPGWASETRRLLAGGRKAIAPRPLASIQAGGTGPRSDDLLEEVSESIRRVESSLTAKSPTRLRDATRRCMRCKAPASGLHCEGCHAALLAEGRLDG